MKRHWTVGAGLVILGGVFAAVTNTGGRTSRVGLLAGVVFVLAGLVRVFRTPPTA